MHLYMSSRGLSDAKFSAPAADCNAPQGPAAVQQPPPNNGAHEQGQQPTHIPLLPATNLGSKMWLKVSSPTPTRAHSHSQDFPSRTALQAHNPASLARKSLVT